MIAQVIPAKRGPLHLNWFDYLVPSELESKLHIGHLVTIPLRSRIEFGIVRSLSTTSEAANSRLKPLAAIVNEQPLLSQAQLAFLEDLSALYSTSLGLLVKSNLLPLQKRKLQKLIARAGELSKSAKKNSKPKVFVYNNQGEKKQYLENASAVGGQLLILVPEIIDVELTLALLPQAIKDQAVAITSDLSVKDFSAAWQMVWRGEKTIVVGTRQALLLPWFDLRTIIIDDEGNPNHKSFDMAPRFHARDAGLLLAQQHGAQLHLLSHALSPETYYFADKKIYEAAGELVPKIRPDATIISLTGERRSGNKGILSTQLVEAIQGASAGTLFFLCHRRGTMQFVSCRDCGQMVRCPTCSEGLVYHHAKNTLECHHCGFRGPMTTSCPRCQGVSLFMIGSGTSAAVSELKKLLPDDKRPIIQIDSDEAVPELEPDRDYIIVGTPLAWRFLPRQSISLAASLDADTPLFIPEYKTAEHAWHELTSLLYRLPPTAAIYLQTDHPEHPIFQALTNPAAWYVSELSARQRFGYPPFRFILKLFAGAESNKKIAIEAGLLHAKLTELTKNDPNVTIAAVQEITPTFQRGSYWRAIIIKLGFSHYKKNSRLILSHVTPEWKVDPNPNTLLSL